LSTDEAKARLLKYGKNILKPPPERSEIVKYLLQFTNGFMLMLMGAGALACIAFAIQPEGNFINLWTGIVLFVVVVCNCTLAYFEERSSSNVMAQFKKMLPPKTRVIRNGKEDIVPAEELVIGDIVKVVSGVYIFYCVLYKRFKFCFKNLKIF